MNVLTVTINKLLCVKLSCDYRIMQIVHSGKLLRLKHLVEISRKTFAVVSFMHYLIDQLYETFAG